ncbi:MAG TPA: ABC transporter permease subunit [Methylosinus sp.]|jgi:ABC-2 type transport system permease protein|uniref:ABC transporter permease subunit n=1 Tax=Methylosinus sp. TaxID=427 RepID=UPI002F92F3A6
MTPIDASLRAPSAFFTILRQELVLLWRERSLPIVLLLLTAVLAGGLADGLQRIDQKDAQLAAIAAEQNKQWDTIATMLKAAEEAKTPTPYASPRVLGLSPANRSVSLPTLPLAPLALGQSDLMTNLLRISGYSEAQFLYDTDIENPWRLTSGQFDAAFVIVFLLPLLVFGLSYNLLSAEREQGTLRLLLAQRVSPASLALGKGAARALALAAPLLAAPLAALLLFRPVADASALLADWLLWSTLALAYGLLWLALAVLVNSFGRSSAFNALALVGAWVAVTLVAPITLNLVVDTIHPALSRAGMIELETEATDESARRNADLDRVDYSRKQRPADGAAPPSAMAMRGKNMQKEISERLRPWVEEYEARDQTRRDFVDAFRILSPAAAVLEGMSALAGTDADRYARFRLAAAEFFRDKTERLQSRLESGVLVTEAEFRAAPRFEWSEDRPILLLRGAWSLAQILVPTISIAAIALWRLRRIPV